MESSKALAIPFNIFTNVRYRNHSLNVNNWSWQIQSRNLTLYPLKKTKDCKEYFWSFFYKYISYIK